MCYLFGGMGWWMAVAGIFWVLAIGGIIWLAVWGINRATGHRGSTAVMDSPLQIAKERYARSEITREQYDQIKKDLS